MSNFSQAKLPPGEFSDALELLHDTVAEQLGSDDFGPKDYLPGLEVLLLSLDYDPQLTQLGKQIAWAEICKTLYARGYAFQSKRRHPEFQTIEIQSPVVITGIPRTGTTALHKLMACDEQFQGLQTWLIGSPMPRPKRDTWEHYPEFQTTVAQLEARYEASPDRRAAHQMAAAEVDECCLVMRQGFVSNIWSCLWSAANYDLWLQTQSEKQCYYYLKSILQLIGCNEANKRWLLKNPGHIANLDLLFAVFPDAKVIHTHRDPAKAIPSLCAMFIKSHELVEHGRRDQRAKLLGLRETEKWAEAIASAELIKTKYREQILDIYHTDFHANPIRELEKIYRFIGLTIHEETYQRMLTRIQQDPERQHGKHAYQVSDFGLTEKIIRLRFGQYGTQFTG